MPKNPQAIPTPVAEELPAIEELVTDPPPIVETPPQVETPESEIEESLEGNVEESVAALPVTKRVEVTSSVPPTEVLPETSPEVSPEPAPRDARRFDPLDFDPESLTLASVDRSKEPVEPAMLGSSDETVERVEKIPSTVPLVRRGPGRGEDTSGRNAEKHLDLLIPEVKFEKLPLLDFLRLISQLSGVPVSVAPEQLLMAGITPQQKVTYKANQAGLGFLLKQVLEPLHLEYTTRGEQVVVTHQDSLKHREINYPIDDLLGEETSLVELAGWVEQLVAPSTWKSAGGEGTLVTTTGNLSIGQTQRVQYQVLIFLERLRLARNLPPRSRYPVKRLVGKPASALLQEEIWKSTTFTFSQYTSIDEIFVYWQTELGVPLLIDWPALEAAEVWPATTIACAIIDQPWNVALEKVLEPLGLGWRATTGGAIEITSAEKVHSELQLELYPLRRDFDGEVAQLNSLAEQQAGGQQAGGAMLYDPVGKALLALQPAATHRLTFRRLSEQHLLLEK